MNERKKWVAGRLALTFTGAAALGGLVMAGCGGSKTTATTTTTGLPNGAATLTQVAAGRQLVLQGGCGDCHNRGKTDPTDPNWLAGFVGAAGATGTGAFAIGPFNTYAANLTPDPTNGLGGVTARQVFNALRYGLDPMATPDVVITSTTPGTGNFPATPQYLAPPMPWPAIRHSADSDLWAIIAYLQHGVKANANVVPTSGGPPDFWASSYTSDKIGTYPAPTFPAASEQFLP